MGSFFGRLPPRPLPLNWVDLAEAKRVEDKVDTSKCMRCGKRFIPKDRYQRKCDACNGDNV